MRLNITRARLSACALLLLMALIGSGCSATAPSPGALATSATATTAPTATSNPADTRGPGSDWTTYHRDNDRSGYLANVPDPRKLSHVWNVKLDGAVYAEPLVVKGHVLVVTEGDTFYSLDARTGKVQWTTNVGKPVPLSDLPCGNIDPLGITGTPVYDSLTGLIFAVAEVTGPAHILVGIDITTGQVKVNRPLDPPGMDPRAQQQRAALALFGNMVYVAYGGLDGDCSDYYGWVVGSRTDGQGSLLSYKLPTTREGGIWATSGPALDATGRLFVAVGNGAATQGKWDHSDSVLRLSPALQLQDGFAPTQWQQDNANDADLGSMGPLPVPGGLIFADGKSGLGYLLNANHLGGIGGQVYKASICTSFGGAAIRDMRIIVPCVSGIEALQVQPGPSLKVLWQASVNGSPVIGGHTVYSLAQSGMLYALDISTGKVITTIAIDQTSRFATPTLSAGRVFVGTLNGIEAISIS